ncbi:MAG: hypothetical protein IPK80_16645 [Nannocystis sp.]|nr:hypothetical protein [Nannocystis sp.]
MTVRALWGALPGRVRVMLGIAFALTAAALTVDLARLAGAGADASLGAASEQLRFSRTIACAAACWLGLDAPPSRVDAALLAAGCALCVPADAFLILVGDLKTGIAIFLVVQSLFIARFARLIVWRRLRERRHRRAVALFVVALVGGNALLSPKLGPVGLALPVAVYSAALLAACLGAWLLRTNPAWPARNAGLAFAGMALFVLCDITVGLGAALAGTPAAAAIRAATGLFYTPSLALLGISARRWSL